MIAIRIPVRSIDRHEQRGLLGAMNVPRAAAIDRSSVSRKALASDGFVQILGGLLLSALLPFIVFHSQDMGGGTPGPIENVLYGSLAAVMVGHYFFRRLVFFPGRAQLILCGADLHRELRGGGDRLLLLRIDYSRLNFASSYLMCVLWYLRVPFHGLASPPAPSRDRAGGQGSQGQPHPEHRLAVAARR